MTLASAPGCLTMDAKEMIVMNCACIAWKYFAQDAARVLWQTIEEETIRCWKENELV